MKISILDIKCRWKDGFKIFVSRLVSTLQLGDPMTPGAMEYSYHSLFEDHKTVKVMSYNLETIIAEKIETVVSRKTDNSRSKDFFDLYLLFNLKTSDIDKNRLHEAVNRTFKYRNTEFDLNSILKDLDDIQLNRGFRNRWKLYCKRNAYVGKLPFDQMMESLKRNVIGLFGK